MKVVVFDFVRGEVRWITLEEANEMMREQEKRGVRFTG